MGDLNEAAAMPRETDWLVVDMDQGLLRRERTRRAALRWCMGMGGYNHVISRHRYGPGAYEYRVGFSTTFPGDTDTDTWSIERVPRARRAGFAGVDGPPLYPYADEPYTQDEQVTALIEAGVDGRWWGPEVSSGA